MAAKPTDTPVSLLHLFHRMGGWLAYIALAMLVGLTVVSHVTLRLADRFDAEGRPATGTVIDREIDISTDSDGDETRTYYLTVQFNTDRPRQITTRTSTGSDIYYDHDIGATLPLWYLESDPDLIELSRGENRATSTLTQTIALVIGIATLAAFWFPARRAVAALRARRYGAEETATVTEVKETNITVNNNRLYRLVWRDASGRTGTSLAYRRQALAPFPAGTQITIYQGLTRAWWSGDTGLRDPRSQDIPVA